MRVPTLLFLASLAFGAYAIHLFGPVLSDLLLLSLISAFASLLLMLRAISAAPKEHIVLDGSNILYWKGNAPSLDTVRAVVDWLKEKKIEPIVWFDANVGYKVEDRYLGPAALASRLGCRQDQVRVAPKGQPADPLLLKDAVRLQARVVSNDSFSDWREKFPQLQRNDLLVRSEIDGGALILRL